MIDIRSKNTYEKGQLIKITENSVIVSFVKNNEESISISFEQFLKNCWCDEETEKIIREKMKNVDTSTNNQ